MIQRHEWYGRTAMTSEQMAALDNEALIQHYHDAVHCIGESRDGFSPAPAFDDEKSAKREMLRRMNR